MHESTAEIAKISTIEWTPQLLYNEPLFKGTNANWSGLLGPGGGAVGFAISETQFVVFILNASRRRSFHHLEFPARVLLDHGRQMGEQQWPLPMMEKVPMNERNQQPVSPMKRVLPRTTPELKPELDDVVNALDPWARDRGQYNSLAWKPRPGAESDAAFPK